MVPLASDGSFLQLLPMGSLELSVKHAHWLRRTIVASARMGDVNGVDFFLSNGDADGDNQVNLIDLGIVLSNFNGSDWMADLDGDGSVSLTDVGQVLLNFGTAGDP